MGISKSCQLCDPFSRYTWVILLLFRYSKDPRRAIIRNISEKNYVLVKHFPYLSTNSKTLWWLLNVVFRFQEDSHNWNFLKINKVLFLRETALFIGKPNLMSKKYERICHMLTFLIKGRLNTYSRASLRFVNRKYVNIYLNRYLFMTVRLSDWKFICYRSVHSFSYMDFAWCIFGVYYWCFIFCIRVNNIIE